MLRAALAIVVFAFACGHHDADPAAAPPKRDAAPPPPVDWTACEQSLGAASIGAESVATSIIIHGCPVCGDWTPLLRWATPHEQGGPTRAAIVDAMTGCNAFCSAEARDRFLGTLDDARGLGTLTPWRWLARVCKDKVSGLPDPRFASPQLFALDRIARAAAAHGDGARLAKLELPLPPLSISGAGVQPPVAKTLADTVPDDQLTITVGELRAGRMPRAHLGSDGVAVDLGSAGYPGDLVADPAKLPRGKYLVIAPRAMPAARIADVLAGTPPDVQAWLAAMPPNTPADWPIVGAIAIAIARPPTLRDGAPTIHVGDPPPAGTGEIAIALRDADTVEALAATLDALAAGGRTNVVVARERKAP